MGRKVFTLTVPSGATVSNELDLAFIYTLTIQGPAVLAEVATVQITVNGSNWQDLTGPVTITANEVQEISGTSAAKLRISLGGAAAADRVFQVSAVEYRP